jgi:hypothetical protein
MLGLRQTVRVTPSYDPTEPPLYAGVLSDVLAAARAQVDEARARVALAERVAELHRPGADGLCRGCGLPGRCPTAQVLGGELEPQDAAAAAGRLLSELAASRIRQQPADEDADERQESRQPARAADGGPGRGSVPAVPSMADLLAPSRGVGNFLDALIPPKS